MKKDYVVLVNFTKGPWYVRCRSDVDTHPLITLTNGLYNIKGVDYMPVYRGNKYKAKRIAATLQTISDSMKV